MIPRAGLPFTTYIVSLLERIKNHMDSWILVHILRNVQAQTDKAFMMKLMGILKLEKRISSGGRASRYPFPGFRSHCLLVQARDGEVSASDHGRIGVYQCIKNAKKSRSDPGTRSGDPSTKSLRQLLKPTAIYSILLQYHQSCHQSSFLHLRRRCFLTLDAPTSLLVTRGPFLLNIAQSLLDLIHRVQVAGVLSHVIADLDRRMAGRRGDLDDDVEGCGLFARGGVGEVV